MSSSVSDKSARILLVSPEVNFHQTLKRILGRCGYRIEVVPTGEKALETISANAYDAVVSHVHLPGAVCGVSLLNHLRGRGFEMPIVLLTEKDTERLRRVLESNSGVTCVSQHGDLDALKSTLAACLAAKPATAAPKSV